MKIRQFTYSLLFAAAVLPICTQAESLKGTVSRVSPGGQLLTTIVTSGAGQLACVTSLPINSNLDSMTALLAVAQSNGVQVKIFCTDSILTSVRVTP